MTKGGRADSGTWLEPVTALGVADGLVLVLPFAVLATVAMVPFDVLEPVT